MFSTSQDLSQDSIQIKQDDKFFSRSRLLSKESSMANPSFRVYYGGGAGAVPFMWESQPGTPKCSFNETTDIPPLTPPPSYYFNPNKNPNKKNSRSKNLLHILFHRMNMLVKSDDHHVSSSPSSSSFSSNSSWSSSNLSVVVPITSPKKYHHPVDSRADYEETEAIGSPTHTLRFSRIKGCYGW